MDKDCGVIRDLLPLYVDGICSDASRRLVEEHVAACPACARELAQLRDSACEDTLRQEARAVLAPRKWRNRAFAASCALAAFACVPACLVAALGRTDGHPLGWLSLLSPSLLVVMAATMLPLRSRRYTGRWTLLGYTASLLLLMMACWVYTADGSPLATVQARLFAAGSALLYLAGAGYIVPWAVRELPLEGAFAGRPRRAALAWDGAFALLLIECAALSAPADLPWALAVGGALLLVLTAVLVCWLWKRLPIAKPARAGICVTLAGNAVCWLAEPFLRLTGAEKNVQGPVRTGTVILLAASMAAGAALTALGAWRSWRASRRS